MALAENSPSLAHLEPYPKSWINRVFDWVDRLPGPYWLYYLLLGLLLMALGSTLKWWDGVYAWGSLFPFHLVFYGSIALGLWGMDDATRSSREAVRLLQPMLDSDPARQVQYLLRHLPPRVLLWSSLTIGLPIGLAYVWIFLHLPQSKLFQGSILSVGFDAALGLAWGVWQVVFLCATFHLQTQIGRVYAHHVKVDLLLPQPLYVLSGVSTRAALVTLFVVYLWLFTFPSGSLYTMIIGIIVGFGLVGMAILVLPLRGIHRRLEAEKRRMQTEVGGHIKATIAKLYEKAESGDFKDLDGLNKLLTSLEFTRQTIDRASTWPWHPDTPRLLLTAMLLPVLLWLTQRLLGRFI